MAALCLTLGDVALNYIPAEHRPVARALAVTPFSCGGRGERTALFPAGCAGSTDTTGEATPLIASLQPLIDALLAQTPGEGQAAWPNGLTPIGARATAQVPVDRYIGWIGQVEAGLPDRLLPAIPASPFPLESMICSPSVSAGETRD